uniref:Phage tail tape measure protein n=1 Tax=Prevotella sp. GTC17262 TaxID=3236797 RepID=A0AB33JJ35_9BACT
MPKLSFRIEADYQKVARLKEEISKLKQEMKGFDSATSPKSIEELNTQLQGLTRELNTVIGRIAEADAKLMESAARIDKAVDTITKAQEKASKSTVGTADTSTAKAQAAAVEGQAKAYLDLKDEIDTILGTREQNIRQMMQEQNTIKLINAEIAQINKSRRYGSGLTATQSQRLQQLNDSLLTHKQALAEVRQELNNNAKLDIAAVGSMNELSQSLSRMRIAYRALNEDERNSQFGQNLLKSIQEADARIKELDAAIGNHQRNVGNYQGRFNGLNMSVQQIVRELPSATMGINMFFMAISNNLPIMADQIKMAKEFNKEMKAAGSEPVPVWKQLVSSIFSWQTAMMVGITLLTVYGKDIIKWVENLFKANDAQEQARKEAEAFANTIKKSHEDWRNSVAQTAAQQITSYRKMQREWNALGNNLNEKKKFVEANKTAFNQLGFAVNGVSDAERVMAGNTDAVVQSIMARAKAAAYYAQMQEATERYIKQSEYNKGTVKGGGYKRNFKAGQELSVKELEYYEKTYGLHLTNGSIGSTGPLDVKGKAFSTASILTATGAKKLQEAENKDVIRRRRENDKKAKDQFNKYINSLQDGLEAVTKENQDLMKKIGVSEYKGYENTSRENGKADTFDPIKAQNNIDAQKAALSQAQIELENQVEQARIDALHEGSEKTLAAMKLAHKKELEQIDKQKEEYLKKKQEEAEAEFKADPKNKGKKFNASSVTLSADEQAKFDTIKTNVEKKQANEVGEYNKKQAEYITAYLKEYGTIQEQREAITKEYDAKIEAETNKWQKKILAKQKEAALSTFDFNAFQNAINWDVVFGNLTKVSKKALDTMEAQLEAMRSKISAKGTLSADEVNELKTITEAIDKIRQRQATLAPFETISEGIKEYGEDLKRLHEVEKAVSDAGGMMYDKENTLAEAYDKAIKAQDMATVAKLQDVTVTVALTDKTGKVTYQTMKYVNALKLLQQQQNKVTSSSDKLQKGINGAGGTLSDISQIGREAEGLADALGVKLPQGIGTAIDGMGDMGQAMENFDITKPGSFLNIKNYIQFAKGLTNAFKGVGETVGGIFGFGGSGARRMREYQEAVAKYSSLKTVWDDLIDRKKEYLNMSWGVEKNKTQAEIMALQEAETKGIVAEAYAYLGTKDKHHGRSHTNYTWQSDAFSNGEYSDRHDHNNEAFWEQLTRQMYAAGFTKDKGGNKLNLTEAADFFNLTYDELLKIMQLYPERWAAMSEQMRGYLKEYMNSLKSAEDFAQEQKDAVIGSISDISNALKSLVDDTDTSMDNLMEAFDKTANAQVWNELTKNGGDYYKRMEAYQKHYQDAVADGHLSVDDKQRLEDEYKSIYADLNAAYDRRKAELGTERSDNQSATANGATEITYEQANNIVALTTAGNITREQIKDRLTLMNATMDDIRALMNQSPTSASYVSDTRQIINNSYAPQIQVSFPKEEMQDIKHDVRELRGIVDEIRSHGVERLLVQQQATDDIARIAKNGTEIKSYVSDIKKDTKNL